MEINWESIEGYSEDLSADDKLALLSKYQPESPAPAEQKPTDSKQAEPKSETKADPEIPKGNEKVIAKSQFDKVASELAAAKKQLRAKMNEDERKADELREAQESMEQELSALRKDKAISGHKAAFLGLGFDEQLADNSANALAENDFDAVFADLKKHTLGLEKSLRAKILKETPVPPAGDNKEAKEVDPFVETFKKG